MSIDYNLNIPGANNNPSDDQPNMRINTNSINQWTGIDHADFSSAFAGKHKQVTFATDAVPSVPTSRPVAFTDTLSGSLSNPGLFFYSGDSSYTTDQYDISVGNGSAVLLGGLIIKWGSTTFSGATAAKSVNFAHPFPNAVFGVFPSVAAQSAPSFYLLNPAGTAGTAPTTVGFTVVRIGSSTPNQTLFWVALGY